MDDPVVRRAEARHAEAIGQFQALAWRQAYRGLVPESFLEATTWQDRAARWRSRIESGERTVWLAWAGNGLVGVSSSAATGGHRPDLPDVELASLYVHELWQGTGTGALLLESAVGSAPAHLWVFAANVRAQRFYEKHGFGPTREEQEDLGTGLREVCWVRATAL